MSPNWGHKTYLQSVIKNEETVHHRQHLHSHFKGTIKSNNQTEGEAKPIKQGQKKTTHIYQLRTDSVRTSRPAVTHEMYWRSLISCCCFCKQSGEQRSTERKNTKTVGRTKCFNAPGFYVTLCFQGSESCEMDLYPIEGYLRKRLLPQTHLCHLGIWQTVLGTYCLFLYTRD